MKHTHIFNIDFYSEQEEKTYTGEFVCKKLAVRDMARLSAERTRLNGGLYHDPDRPGCGIDEDTNMFNHMLAHLTVAIVRAPEWWDLDSISDMAVVSRVFEEVATFENSFLKRRGDNSSSENSERSDSPDQGANHAGNLTRVVGKEVQSTLEP